MQNKNSFEMRAIKSLRSLVQSGQFQGKAETTNFLNFSGPTRSCYGVVVKPQLG